MEHPVFKNIELEIISITPKNFSTTLASYINISAYHKY
jgi:hypothetical protein